MSSIFVDPTYRFDLASELGVCPMFERFLIFALLVSAAVAMPARGHSDIGWTRTETANFEFVGNAPEASIRIVADRLER